MKQTAALLLLLLVCAIPLGAAGGVPLIDAVKADDRAAVQRLMKAGSAVNVPERDGTTALHWAVRADSADMVRLLLGARANANAANRYGVTPLVLAALNGSERITDLLLKAGANPNVRLAEDQTVLMAAARAGNAQVVKLLLEAGADAQAREQVLGETALMWAALENHAGAVSVLVRHGADVNARSTLTAPPRFKFGDGIVARPTVLAKGGWTPLMYAARENAVDAARALADAGADLNVGDPDGTSALMFAIINAHFDLAMLLIEKGADPNVADVTGAAALYAAVDMNTLDETVGRPNPKPHGTADAPAVIAALLAHGANTDARLKTPVLERVHNDGDPSLAEGATPLMRAAKDADLTAMRLLLDGGADLGAKTKTGRTALMYAASRASGFRGTTNRGSEQEALDAIALCLERGADINAVDANGQSALHVAVAQAEESVIRLLAERGANLHLKDQRGRTALDLASGGAGGGRGGGRAAGNDKKAALLRELMAPTR